MAFNYEYPYVDPNRYNADWLLNVVKKVDEEYDRLVKEFDEIKTEFQELSDKVDSMFGYIDEHIAEQMAIFRTEFRGEIDRLDRSLDMYQTALVNLKKYVDDNDTEQYMLMIEHVNELHAILQAEIDDLYELIKTYNAFMIDPLTLEYRPLADVIRDNYERERYGGLTDPEFCALNMTVAEYDAYNLTAEQWALQARYRLTDYGIRRALNPLTGTKTTPYNVDSWILTFLVNAPDCASYVSADQDVATWDALDMTVLQYMGI